MNMILAILCVAGIFASAAEPGRAWTMVNKPAVLGWSYNRFVRQGAEIFALPGLSSSRDGGRTWKDHSGAEGLFDVAFKTPREWIGNYETLGQLRVSSDRGAAWKAVADWEKNGYSNLGFFDEKNGFGVGAGRIGVTDDGGLTWRRLEKPRGFHAYTDPRAVRVFDGRKAMIAIGGPKDLMILRTADRGASWEVSTVAGADEADAACFVDEKTGWLLTDRQSTSNAAIRATEDGGKTWSRIPLGADKAKKLTSLACRDAKTIWAAGPGAILASADGGRTWPALDGPATESAEDVGLSYGRAGDEEYLLLGTSESHSTGIEGGAGEDKLHIFPNGAIYRLQLGAAAR